MNKHRRLYWPHTALKLNPIELTVREEISNGLSIWVTVWSQHHFEVIASLLGSLQSIEVKLKDCKRIFSGICSQAKRVNAHLSYPAYHIKLIGIMNILEHHQDSRIHQNSTLQQYLSILLKRHLFNAQFNCQHNPTIPLHIQYDETDHAYFKRLCSEHQYMYWQQHGEHPLIKVVDAYFLQQKPNRNSFTDSLIRMNHQLWHYKNNNCYSNYPDIQLGDRIQNQTVIKLHHHIIDDGTQHHYYQHIVLSSTLALKKIIRKGTGLNIVKWHQNHMMTYDWDRYQTPCPAAPLKTNTDTNTILATLSNQSPLIVRYHAQHLTSPQLIGFLYSKSHPSPFLSGHQYAQGYKSSHQCYIKFTSSHTLTWFSPQTIHFKTNSTRYQFKGLAMHLNQQLQFNTKKLHIISDSAIHLMVGNTQLKIELDKIIINSSRIDFNHPGIVDSTSN